MLKRYKRNAQEALYKGGGEISGDSVWYKKGLLFCAAALIWPIITTIIIITHLSSLLSNFVGGGNTNKYI